MLGKFIAGDFIAIAGEMRRFPASNENTVYYKKCFKSVLRTFTKFVLFSNQKVRKYLLSLKLLGKSVYSYKSRPKAIVYDFVEKSLNIDT
jgi:hypothetical protein